MRQRHCGRIRIFWNNPWVRGITIAILGILIGQFIIPFIEYTCSQPRVEVVYPVSGEAVYWNRQGSTVVGNHWKLQHNHIYVLLHPTDTPWWYVQPQATPLNENMWRAKVYYGTKPEEAGQFDILALMTTTKLTSGTKYALEELQGLKRESSAISNVVTVTKIPTPIPQTGTIEVTSNLPAARFSVTGPASYSGVSPWAKADAPVGTYAIIWGSMNDYETPPPQTVTLPQAEKTISFHGVYRTLRHALTINVSGQGTTEPNPGTHTYDKGTQVTITASPASGYRFDHWEGDAPGTSTSVTITMDSDKAVIACFVLPSTHTLTINVSGQGTTEPNPGTHTYDKGTQVTITASPSSGYVFDHWGGDASGTKPSVTITMDSDKVVIACFVTPPPPHTLTINVSGQGTTSPSPGSHEYTKGTQVTITASPSSGYVFDHWGGNASGTKPSVTITMDSDKVVIACFRISEYTRECEYPDEHTVGQTIWRSNASVLNVHGQFGCESFDPWTVKAGYVKYNIPELHSGYHLYLVLRYSKNSPSTTPIRIYLDEETQPRAAFILKNQGSWNKFTETEPIDLGQITTGTHTIKFSTDGQQYGVADLDKFTCSYLIE